MNAQVPAFPGAQGFGRFATGGRGGSVYYVTTTNDSGPGSFRDAVSQPNRTVVFAVSGVIDYKPPRYNVKNNITIAGQTAPGDGVVLYGDGIGYTDADNTITRFIRFRMGKNGTGEDTVTVARGSNMIFDHISATWSLDEVFSVSGSPDPSGITIQSSIIGQGLEEHSAGGLIQTAGGVSIVGSLYIDNGTRNPKVKGVNEFVNNVVYNWKTDAYILGDSAGDSYANVIGNYFINGPNSGSSGAFSRGNLNFHLFAADNWQDKNRNGVLDGVLLMQSDYDVNDWQASPYPYPVAPEAALPALTALKVVVSEVGPSWRRDEVDNRLIEELTSWGLLGQTIFSEFDPPMNGPGRFRAGVVPTDTDLDGMPDYWESGLGMDIHVPNNNAPSPTARGYTQLEDYLNWLAGPHGVAMTNTPVEVDLRQFTRGFTNFNPVYSIANVTAGTATLNGHRVRFEPALDHVGLAGFQFTVVDAHGSTITRLMRLFFTPQPPPYRRVWRGDALANNWEVNGDANWSDEESLLYPFHNGDAVAFDERGYSVPAVNLSGSLQPASVLVDSSTDYTFAGTGSLDGAMALTKLGGGRLIIETTNTFSGPTVVSNGTLTVQGALKQSAVSVYAGATVAGDGLLGAGLVAHPGSTVSPGKGIGFPGTLTIDGGFTGHAGTILRFDLSDDPTGVVKTNDRIDVAGNLTLAATNTIQVNLLDGVPGDGMYVLFTYTGSFIGSLGNIKVVGAHGTLTNLPGTIALIVSSERPPADLVWAGDGVNNIWDHGTNGNWRLDGVPDRFYFLDRVRFDDSGSQTPAVQLIGVLEPASVVVDAVGNYTFAGPGRISGTTGLLKTNSGSLTVSNANDFTGPTIVAGGVLAVSQLANGGTPSGIGAASSNPSNLVLNGGALRYLSGNTGTDRGLTLATGGGTIDVVAANTVLTWSGVLAGNGTLIKSGAGQLNLNGANTFTGGTIVNAGTVRLVNMNGFGSGPVTLNGHASPVVFRFGEDQQTLDNPLVVEGTNNFVMLNGNNILSQVSGNGTLEGLVSSGTTLSFGGNMSGFSGTIRAGAIPNLRFNPSTGSGSATFDLGDGSCKLNNRNGNLTIHLGALMGGPNTILEGASNANNPTTYVIGAKNLDTTFAGRIQEVTPVRSVAITKVGTGTLTLTGVNRYNGPTIVNGGTLLVNNTGGTGTGTNSVTVNDGGTLGGTGFIHGPVVVNSGGILAPGNGGPGTLTLRSNLTLNPGSRLRFDVGNVATTDRIVVNGNLVLGGTLHVTPLPGLGEGALILMTYSGTVSGTLQVAEPPAGFDMSVDTIVPSQVRLNITRKAQPVFRNWMHADGALVLSGDGGYAHGSYFILSTTNLALPAALWERVSTNNFDSEGRFSFTNTIDGVWPTRFYRLALP